MRVIVEKNQKHTMFRLSYSISLEEYQVKVYERTTSTDDWRRNVNRDYFTSDHDDAYDTMREMVREAMGPTRAERIAKVKEEESAKNKATT